MSELPSREPATELPADTHPAAALVLWALGQLVVLAAIWADVRLSVNPGHAAGRLGPQFLLAGQLVLSAVLAADLAGTRLLAALAFAMAFLFTQLTAWRCQTPAAVSLSNAAVILLWLVGLTCWMTLVRGSSARLLMTLLLVAWIVGAPLLCYVLAEFSPDSGIQRLLTAFAPLMLTGHTADLLVVMAVHAGLAGAAAGITWMVRRSA